jgi:hypothetical protein
VERLGGKITKGVAKGQRPKVLCGGGLFDALELVRVAEEVRGDIIDVVATVLYAKIGPMVGSAAGVMLTAVGVIKDGRGSGTGGTDLRYARRPASLSKGSGYLWYRMRPWHVWGVE